MSTHVIGGYSYFITFTNDFSRYGHVYLMKYKFEAFEKFRENKNEVKNQIGKSIKTLQSDQFREYKNEVENQTKKSIKTLQSDQGGEYLSIEFT